MFLNFSYIPLKGATSIESLSTDQKVGGSILGLISVFGQDTNNL